MKYVLLGSISPSWISKQAERYKKSNDKLKQLGINKILFFIRRGSTTLLKRLMLQVQNQYWVLRYGIPKKDLATFRHCQPLEIRKYGR